MQGQKHHSGLDKNNTDERLEAGHQTHPTFGRRIPAKHVQGSSEEIQGRVGGSFISLPDDFPSKFKQIDPAAAAGNRDINNPVFNKHYDGNRKFGSSVSAYLRSRKG